MYVNLRTRFLKNLRRKSERGATIVLVTILMVALLGMAAISVDFAIASADKSQAQNAADAAALSIARECAMKTTNCTPSGATGEIAWSLSQNAPGKTGAATPSVAYSNKQVTVTVQGNRPTTFARVLGDNNAEVTSRGTASWGHVAVEGEVDLPVAIGYCDWKDANPGGNPDGVVREYVFGNVSNFLGILNPGCDVLGTTIPAAAGRRAYNASSTSINFNNYDQLGWINSNILGISTNCEARIRSWGWFDIMNFNLFTVQNVCDPKSQALATKLQAAKAAGKPGIVILIPVFGIQNWYLNVFGLFTLTGSQRMAFHGFAPFELQGFMNRKAGWLAGLEVGGVWRSDNCRLTQHGSYNWLDPYWHKCRGYYGKWIRTTRPIEGWEYENLYNNNAAPDFGATKVTLTN